MLYVYALCFKWILFYDMSFLTPPYPVVTGDGYNFRCPVGVLLQNCFLSRAQIFFDS